MGHHYSFATGLEGSPHDGFFDDRYSGMMERSNSRSTIWVMQALRAQDQLRQRMAWGLSQIAVVSLAGLPTKDQETELWLNYYDIFVRNAFGNYRDPGHPPGGYLQPGDGNLPDAHSEFILRFQWPLPERELCPGDPAALLGRAVQN